MSDGEKSGPDRGMSDRQKSLGKCAMPKQLVMTKCFFCPRPVETKISDRLPDCCICLKTLIQKTSHSSRCCCFDKWQLRRKFKSPRPASSFWSTTMWPSTCPGKLKLMNSCIGMSQAFIWAINHLCGFLFVTWWKGHLLLELVELRSTTSVWKW